MSIVNATAAQQFQPNFVAYATAHGRQPAAQLEHDKGRWKGGCMTGFILWVSEQKQAFRKVNPKAFLGDSIADLKAWGAFLQAQGKAGVRIQ